MTQKTGLAPLFDTAGNLLTENVDKANALNNAFKNSFTVDDGSIPVFPRRVDLQDELDTVYFTEDIVSDYLRKLKPKLSAGPDNIPGLFLKQLRFHIAKPLSKIFQVSFGSGFLPRDWLVASVTPIFKKGLSSDPLNYRPISLTSTCCKIMESIIKDTMTSYLTKNKLLSLHQHGFVKHKSTDTLLLECMNEWTKGLEAGQRVDVIYIDYAKAFDSVCHSKLLTKLEGYGISGSLYAWIQAFLSN